MTIILVGDDVDITDLDQVKQSGLGGKSVMSCLWPEQFGRGSRGETSSFRTSFPEVRRNVVANWTRYGFRDSVTH